MMYAVNALGVLRVSEEGEMIGLDIHEHGIPAYPEYSLLPSASPQGTSGFNSQAFGSQAALKEVKSYRNTGLIDTRRADRLKAKRWRPARAGFHRRF